MSSKENAAINQLLEKLERRYALRVLWALRDGHPQTFRLLQDSVGGITPNTLNTRIKELRDMFGPLVLTPQLPERTSLQQAQGAAKPLHIWPGDSAQELAADFDSLLDRIVRTGRIPVSGASSPA